MCNPKSGLSYPIPRYLILEAWKVLVAPRKEGMTFEAPAKPIIKVRTLGNIAFFPTAQQSCTPVHHNLHMALM